MIPSISIIIPVYNGRHSLKTSVQSALTQDVENMEIIIVDDGSTDGTADEARRLMAADSRIKLLKHEYNKGLSLARVTGIAASQKEYVAFLDCGDSFKEGCFRRILEGIENESPDIIECRMDLDLGWPIGTIPFNTDCEEVLFNNTTITGSKGIDHAEDLYIAGKIARSVITKIFRREFLLKYQFPGVSWFCGEDTCFTMHYAGLARSIHFSPITLLVWKFSGLDAKYYVKFWDGYQKSVAYVLNILRKRYEAEPDTLRHKTSLLADAYFFSLLKGILFRSYWLGRRAPKKRFLKAQMESEVFRRLAPYIRELSNSTSEETMMRKIMALSRKTARKHRKFFALQKLLGAVRR